MLPHPLSSPPTITRKRGLSIPPTIMSSLRDQSIRSGPADPSKARVILTASGPRAVLREGSKEPMDTTIEDPSLVTNPDESNIFDQSSFDVKDIFPEHQAQYMMALITHFNASNAKIGKDMNTLHGETAARINKVQEETSDQIDQFEGDLASFATTAIEIRKENVSLRKENISLKDKMKLLEDRHDAALEVNEALAEDLRKVEHELILVANRVGVHTTAVKVPQDSPFRKPNLVGSFPVSPHPAKVLFGKRPAPTTPRDQTAPGSDSSSDIVPDATDPAPARSHHLLPTLSTFSGRKSEYAGWAAAAKAKICTDGHLLGSNVDKLNYLWACLAPAAYNPLLAWYDNAASANPPLGATDLLKYMDKQFISPNRRRLATSQLYNMTMKSGQSFGDFYPAFQRLVQEAGQTHDGTIFEHLLHTLNKEMHDAYTMTHPLPSTTDELVERLQEFEAAKASRGLSWRQNAGPKTAPSSTTTSKPTPASSTGQIPSGKLTYEERKNLAAKGACFRCRKTGHLISDCPLSVVAQPVHTEDAPAPKKSKHKAMKEELEALRAEVATLRPVPVDTDEEPDFLET